MEGLPYSSKDFPCEVTKSSHLRKENDEEREDPFTIPSSQTRVSESEL